MAKQNKGHENLIPVTQRTKEEARAISRAGGIASGETRRRQRQLKDDLIMLLEMIGDNDKTNQENIATATIAKALNGDIRAVEFIRDTVGEKPDQNMTISADVGLSAEDRALLAEANKLYASRS